MVKGWKDELALHNLQSKSLSMKVHSRCMVNSQNSAIKYKSFTHTMGTKHDPMSHQREGIVSTGREFTCRHEPSDSAN